MYTFDFQLRVRYKDVDQMGYVYYGNYAYYYEQARAECIRHIGVSYREIEASGILMPITRMNIKYIAPAFYDDLLTIKTIIPEKPGRLIRFLYEVFNPEGKKINEGETILTFIRKADNKLVSAPEILQQKLSPFFSP